MSADGEGVLAFLKTVHRHSTGVIELRGIEEGRGGEVRERKWYGSPEELVADLPRLNEMSERYGAGVFYGVLPRREPGQGGAESVIAGYVVWNDLDFKDFPGGEQEARERLQRLPTAPSIVVASGHGLHPYWLLSEPTDPEVISSLSRRFAKALGGDHVHDRPRLLRLPGTLNRKDPQKPLEVTIELFEPEFVYTADGLRAALDEAFPEKQSKPKERPAKAAEPMGDLDPRILALVDRDRRISSLFRGTGKPALGNDGRPLDASSSGYDFSLLLALIRAGIKDPDLLANALWNRPDRGAREKGADYTRRTVETALQRMANAEDLEEVIDFKVTRVRVFASNPAVFELTIEGVEVRMNASVLRSPRAFCLAFMNALRRIPKLPDVDQWPQVVNGWLAEAEVVEQPPEASAEPALREAVAEAVSNLPPGEVREDLDHGKAVALTCGRLLFKVSAVMRALREDFPHLERQDCCRVLRDLGFESGSHTIAGASVRAWSDNTQNAREEKQS